MCERERKEQGPPSSQGVEWGPVGVENRRERERLVRVRASLTRLVRKTQLIIFSFVFNLLLFFSLSHRPKQCFSLSSRNQEKATTCKSTCWKKEGLKTPNKKVKERNRIKLKHLSTNEKSGFATAKLPILFLLLSVFCNGIKFQAYFKATPSKIHFLSHFAPQNLNFLT